MVERQLPKLNVAGSIPVSRSNRRKFDGGPENQIIAARHPVIVIDSYSTSWIFTIRHVIDLSPEIRNWCGTPAGTCAMSPWRSS